jgi:hypothetical protein
MNSFRSRRLSVSATILLVTVTVALCAEPPAWWTSRGVTVPGSVVDDYAAANVGQLKNMANAACLEMEAVYEGGAGPGIRALVDSWSQPSASRDDFTALTAGQLKFVASKFHERQAEVRRTPVTYPWNGGVATDDFALVNVGQLKAVFAFQITPPPKQTQSISFAPLATKGYGDPSFDLAATASSGLPVHFACLDETVARVSGATVTIVGVGSVVIRASQDGDSRYEAAPPVQHSLLVTKGAQTIAFTLRSTAAYGDSPFSLTASVSSNLPVTVESLDPSIADIVNGEVVIHSVGTATFRATQPGNEYYDPAPEVTRTLTVSPRGVRVIATAVSKTYGEADPDSLPFSVVGAANADISGSLAREPGESPGEYTITQGTLSSGPNFQIVEFTSSKLTISKSSQTIAFDAIGPVYLSDGSLVLNASSTSGLGLSFAIGDAAIATVDAGVVTFQSIGSTTITATQPGNENYDPAPAVTRTLTVSRKAVSVVATAVSKTYSEADPDSFPFSVVGAANATISGSLARELGELPGEYTITQGTLSLGPNFQIQFTSAKFTISKIPQTIDFDAIDPVYLSDGSLELDASSTSELGVSFAIGNPAIATVNGSVVTLHAIGSTTITATQAGDMMYLPAPDVTQILEVRPGNVITFGEIPDKYYYDVPFDLVASASSGLPVSFSSSDDEVATVSGNTVTIVDVGEVEITATQGGDNAYIQAAPVTRVLRVLPRTITVTAASASCAYGAQEPPLTYTVSGLWEGEELTGSLTRQSGSDPGSYEIFPPPGGFEVHKNGVPVTGWVVSFIGAYLTITGSLPDSDYDGLPDNQESSAIPQTDYRLADTDFDGAFDGAEIYSYDPLDPDRKPARLPAHLEDPNGDYDYDRIANLNEHNAGTSMEVSWLRRQVPATSALVHLKSLNDRGEVLALAFTSYATKSVMRWSGAVSASAGQWELVKEVPGVEIGSNLLQNNRGLIVGWTQYAFWTLDRDGTIYRFTVPSGGSYLTVHSITDSGFVFGSFLEPKPGRPAGSFYLQSKVFRWRKGSMETLLGSGIAATNRKGRVVFKDPTSLVYPPRQIVYSGEAAPVGVTSALLSRPGEALLMLPPSADSYYRLFYPGASPQEFYYQLFNPNPWASPHGFLRNGAGDFVGPAVTLTYSTGQKFVPFLSRTGAPGPLPLLASPKDQQIVQGSREVVVTSINAEGVVSGYFSGNRSHAGTTISNPDSTTTTIAGNTEPFAWRPGGFALPELSEFTDGKVNASNNPGMFAVDYFELEEKPWYFDDDETPDGTISVYEQKRELFVPNNDSDQDHLPDDWERRHFFGLTRSGAEDPDTDGLSNWDEYIFRTNPNASDTDSDSVVDAIEVDAGMDPLVADADEDVDGDGGSWVEEFAAGSSPYSGADSDGDGLSDYEEGVHGTNPLNADTDSDKMPDGWEIAHGLNATANDAGLDPDDDDVNNLDEFKRGTNPQDGQGPLITLIAPPSAIPLP